MRDRKRQDHELVCKCTHVYHAHERPAGKFSHSGHCTQCDCRGFEDMGPK